MMMMNDVKALSFSQTSNGFICASVQQRNQISKKSLAMNVTQLMVDFKLELQKKTGAFVR